MKKKSEKKYITAKFTLIELLIVISIITILAGLLLPALKNAREKVLQIECQNKMKQMASAVIMYSVDFGGYGPAGDAVANGLFIRDVAGGIAAYLNVKGELLNFSNTVVPPVAICSKGGRYGGTDPSSFNMSYGLNTYLVQTYSGELKRVKNAAGRMLGATIGIDDWANLDTPAHGSGAWARNRMGCRHFKGGIFSYVDGHVNWLKYENIPLDHYDASDPTNFYKEY
ncbi:MAG: hypothetical protein A2017_14065 [Lentisphaerae bacterium GWF2_44_16]|nr:MAG: hypothetical protein A2017_14065 [Lentisphaerae bacterium GWF2_44_16]